MKPEHAVELVVFDAGGVLVRIARSWEEACALAGLPAPAAQPGFDERRGALARAHQRGELPTAEYCERVARASDGLYAPADVERVLDAWMLGEYPGVAALTAELRERGVATAVLSNTNPRHWDRQLTARGPSGPRFPALAHIDRLYASHLLGLLKPDAEIFRALERETGAGAPAMLFFDDTPANVEAARACGWAAEWVDHAGDPAAQMRAVLRRYGVL